MRRLFLVTYDISDSRRLRRVHRVMRDHGDALQYSVFRCRLSEQEKIELIAELSSEMVLSEDRIMLADLGPASGLGPERVEWIGRRPQEPVDPDGTDTGGPLVV